MLKQYGGIKNHVFDHETRKSGLFPCYRLKINYFLSSYNQNLKMDIFTPCSKFLAAAKVGLAHYDSFRGGGSQLWVPYLAILLIWSWHPCDIFSMKRECSGIDKRCSQMKEGTRNTLTSLQSRQEQVSEVTQISKANIEKVKNLKTDENVKHLLEGDRLERFLRRHYLRIFGICQIEVTTPQTPVQSGGNSEQRTRPTQDLDTEERCACGHSLVG